MCTVPGAVAITTIAIGPARLEIIYLGRRAL